MRANDNRLFFNAVVWIMRTGCPWPDLPERFGIFNTVSKRFRRLAKKGVWDGPSGPCKPPDWTGSCSTRLLCGRTSIRRARKSDPETECLGRSRGGIGTKIHACIESLGNAVRLIATSGQAGNSPQALSLLADLQPGKVLADTACDSDATRAYCAEKGIEAVIPGHPGLIEALLMDEEAYRDRNKVERFLAASSSIAAWPRATRNPLSHSLPSSALV